MEQKRIFIVGVTAQSIGHGVFIGNLAQQ